MNWQAFPHGSWADSRPGVPPRALVCMLSGSEIASGVCETLAEAWRRRLPSVAFVTLSAEIIEAESHGAPTSLLAAIAWELACAGLTSDRLVLACLGSACSLGLDLATSHTQPCSGVLAMAGWFSPGPKRTGLTRLHLRFVRFGAAADACTAPPHPGLYRDLKASGADSSGLVLDADGPLAPAAVRLGGAYLGELIAFSLAQKGRT